MTDPSPRIGDIAQALLGPPNVRHSTKTQLRFGSNGSVAVEIAGEKAGTWFDHEAGIGGGPWDLLRIKGGMANGAAVDWLHSNLGIQITGSGHSRIVATYDYRDEAGRLLYQVCRFSPKDFRQRRPDGHGGWTWKLGDTRRVLYRLPELIAAPPEVIIYLAEGEKDCDRLADLGLTATCNPGGAGKWRPEFSEFLRRRHVVVLPDNDAVGRAHAAAVATALSTNTAEIRVLELTDLPPKGDVSDWIAAGGTRQQLEDLAAATRAFTLQQPGSELSEDALALKFTRRHGHDLRYVAEWGSWLWWNNERWVRETTLKAFDMARAVAREAAPPGASRVLSAKTIRRDRAPRPKRPAARRNHRRLGPLNLDIQYVERGRRMTINLETGVSYAPRREDYCTKIAAVAPNGRGCPLWHDFLDRVTDGDAELQTYMQRVAGYCMTGSIREHVLFLLYGTGANGKGVFLNTLRGIWGDYAVVAPMATFIESHSDRHPTELAHLRGARLVIAQETERGRRWAESKIKAMTGGDPISARYMRQNFFEFTPQFKLMIAGNHKPALRGVDEAIRRRIHLIPFTVTIPPEERDKNLAEKLKAEWGGILHWAVEGCHQWQMIGLAPPPAVLNATDQYLHDEDALGQWIEECCALDPIYFALVAGLFADWRAWAEARGEYVGSQKRFSQALRDRKFAPDREGGTGKSGFRGIALRP